MATVSSHILDSIDGGSAVGIRAQLFRIESNGLRTKLFDISADQEGRIAELVELAAETFEQEYELVFHSRDYFLAKSNANQEPFIAENGEPTMKTVVVRLTMKDKEKRYHIPIMLAPHSYSVWWSK
ncbi:MAG: hypothetical protein GKR95_05925 [Gammaproteobacteria bacterium]|nr:hypothetical protein [Gammaproteobacteria bacterium]